MTFMNSTANIKQFMLLRFINENCDDDHVMSKITINLRRDKIEAPYYMITKIRLSTCIDRPENGLNHAMDILNHTRRHNLTEEAYGEIRKLISEAPESDLADVSESGEGLKMVVMSRNDDEIERIFRHFGDLFDRIDNLVD